MLDAAPFANEISGTKAKTFPAWIAPNVVLYKKKISSDEIKAIRDIP
jgi:hypothetical protein